MRDDMAIRKNAKSIIGPIGLKDSGCIRLHGSTNTDTSKTEAAFDSASALKQYCTTSITKIDDDGFIDFVASDMDDSRHS